MRTPSWLKLTPRTLAIAAAALVLSDASSVMAGDSFFPGGPIDETAHLLTALVVMWTLGPKICERYLVPALIASVAIDIDHIPHRLGYSFLDAHVPRPYSHSLLTIAIVLVAAGLWRKRRTVLVGVALGLVIHFWRDLADPGSAVSLLWPFTYHYFSIPHAAYAVGLAGVVVFDWWRCREQRPGPARPRPEREPLDERAAAREPFAERAGP